MSEKNRGCISVETYIQRIIYSWTEQFTRESKHLSYFDVVYVFGAMKFWYKDEEW
jgi:hypothetical protein